MEHIIFVAAFAGGLVCGLFGTLIKLGQQEGNREDYTIKIGLLKAEKQKLQDKLVYSDSLLETANSECHRLQQKLHAATVEIQKLHDLNTDLRIVIRDTDTALQLVRKAQ